MNELDRPQTDREIDTPVTADAELSETDLDCVVGGLARPWTDTAADDWLFEPVQSVL
jgi:hypothetical protein